MDKRIIMFRGKRIDNGEWVCGDLIHGKLFGRDFPIIRINDNGTGDSKEYPTHYVMPETVGQFTGMRDKDGTEIYEDDILEHDSAGYTKKYGKPVVHMGDFIDPYLTDDEHGEDPIQIYGVYLTTKNNNVAFMTDCTKFFKVCGNIHDNPVSL